MLKQLTYAVNYCKINIGLKHGGIVREKACCFTGHRKISVSDLGVIKTNLPGLIISLIDKGYRVFYTGGALGFDTEAALTVLSLREEYPEIKLITVLPCLDQVRGWSARDIEVYEEINERCDEVVFTARVYYKGCMHARNRYMVDNSAACIAFLKHKKGGTAYTMEYALSCSIEVINLAELCG